MRATEIRCFWLYSFTVILLTTIPYLLGLTAEGSEWVFTGFVFGVEDGNSYIAKMLLGASGDWLFRTPYSAAQQSGVLAFLPYLLLGKLAAGPELHLQLVILFHLFRIAVIPLAIWATYRFVDYVLQDKSWSAWATVLATIGSGLGWLPVLLGRSELQGSMPLGFISPETFGFLAYLGLPHLMLARALLLLALRWYLEGAQCGNGGWKAGGALAALGFVQPLAMVSAYAVIAIHQILTLLRFRSSGVAQWKQSWLQTTLRTLGISLPVFLYFFVTFSIDPFLKLWTDQNLILSPHAVHYLLAYGLLLPFTFVGLVKAWSSGLDRWLLPLGWALIIPALAYAPYNLQRRLPEGSWTALVVLSAYGLSRFSIGYRAKNALRVILVTLSLVTPMMLVYGGIRVASSPGYPAFRRSREIEAFQWFEENALKDSVVLASFETGNALPAWAPLHVVIGHGPESANLAELRPLVRAYFAGEMTDNESMRFLASQGVDYVFFGPREKALGGMESLSGSGLLQVHAQQGYTIYMTAE